MENAVSIWRPLRLDPAWYSVSTAKFDNILPSCDRGFHGNNNRICEDWNFTKINKCKTR